MLDGETLRRVIEEEKPDLIVPEIEAIATDTLVRDKLEPTWLESNFLHTR